MDTVVITSVAATATAAAAAADSLIALSSNFVLNEPLLVFLRSPVLLIVNNS